MAPEFCQTPLARRDLAGIHDWTSTKFGRQQADRYVADIASVFMLVAENPGIAREAGDVRKDLFKCVSSSQVIFLRFQKNTVTIVRILHGSMDFNRWL